MVYLCIDTNIYVGSCLLELEEDDPKFLDTLLRCLDNGQLELLLPEVIELEFFSQLSEKSEKLKQVISEYKTSIGHDKSRLDKKVADDLIKKLDECLVERQKNRDEVGYKIKQIFNHKNTHRIMLKSDHLIGAYKNFLSKEKPYSEKLPRGANIQPDCLIIEALVDFLESQNGYELYFWSNNTSDFSNKNSLENKTIHPDIWGRFSHIEFISVDLFNSKFDTKLGPELAEKLEEQETIHKVFMGATGPTEATIIKDIPIDELASGIGPEGLAESGPKDLKVDDPKIPTETCD